MSAQLSCVCHPQWYLRSHSDGSPSSHIQSLVPPRREDHSHLHQPGRQHAGQWSLHVDWSCPGQCAFWLHSKQQQLSNQRWNKKRYWWLHVHPCCHCHHHFPPLLCLLSLQASSPSSSIISNPKNGVLDWSQTDYEKQDCSTALLCLQYGGKNVFGRFSYNTQ